MEAKSNIINELQTFHMQQNSWDILSLSRGRSSQQYCLLTGCLSTFLYYIDANPNKGQLIAQ